MTQYMVNKILIVFVALLTFHGWGATMSWTSVHRTGWSLESVDPLITITDVKGSVRAEDGVGASVTGMIFTRTDTDGTSIKAYDYSGTAAPVNTRWLLAVYGDILEASTMSSFRNVELTTSYDYGTGGDKISDPSNFYLVFVAENWNDYVSGVENSHKWYGWVNLTVDAEGALDILGSAVATYGNVLVVGGGSATPEPSCALLLLIGIGVLGLRRRLKGLSK